MIAKAGESPGVFPYYGPCSAARTSAPTQSLRGPIHRALALKGTSTSLESVPSAAFPSTICCNAPADFYPSDALSCGNRFLCRPAANAADGSVRGRGPREHPLQYFEKGLEGSEGRIF